MVYLNSPYSECKWRTCIVPFSQKIAGEIKEFSHEGYVNPKMAKRMDKFMWYLLTAGKKALEDAGMTSAVLDSLDKSKCGILIGSAMGGMQVRPETALGNIFNS